MPDNIIAIENIERYDIADLNLLNPIITSDIQYGIYTLESGEIIQFHVYDDGGNYISSIDNLIAFSDADRILFSENQFPLKAYFPVQSHLRFAGFRSGTYSATYNFLKSYLYPNLQWYLGEISTSRREVRLFATDSSFNIGNLFGNTTISSDDSSVIIDNPNALLKTIDGLRSDSPQIKFMLDFGKNNIFVVVNQAVDAETNSLVFRLYKPLPDEIVEKMVVNPVTEFANPIKITATISANTQDEQPLRILAGPNRNIDIFQFSSAPSMYQSWEDVLSTHPITSQNLIDHYLSSSNYQSTVNVDYSDYNNFVHFSSIEERVKNFFYKLQLIEQYSASYALLTNVTGSASASISASSDNLSMLQRQVINGFDGYEKWLYFESGSTFSSSLGYGEITQSTWPKTNNTIPYTLSKTTSNEGISWYLNEVENARDFDSQNQHNLLRSVPFHVLFDEANAPYLLFLNMIGQHFDTTWTYINYFTQQSQREHRLDQGSAKDLSWDILRSYGFELVNGNDVTSLWKYAFGTDISGSYENNTFQYSMADATKEIWKRMLNNLPYLLKTKGTERGVRALISCYGIPSTMLRIREYGGPDPDKNTTDTQYISDVFTYALSLTQPAWVSSSWATYDTRKADAIEFRFATANSPSSMSLFETYNLVGKSFLNIQTIASASLYQNVGGYVQFTIKNPNGSLVTSSRTVELPIYNNEYWSVLFQRSSGSGNAVNQTFTLYVKHGDFGRIVHETSTSLFIASSSALATSWESASLFAIGSGSTPNTYVGTMQEFRLWKDALFESVFDNHVLAPTAYNGNSYTTAYSDLLLRYRFNHAGYYELVNGSYVISSSGTLVLDTNPLQTSVHHGIAQVPSSASFFAQDEKNSFIVPNIGNSRFISNKVRIDTVVSMSGDLNTKRRVTENKFDTAPSDTNKVGVYLSPADLINEDIIRTFTDFNIDNFIGNPTDEFKWNYPDLELANRIYWTKYDSPPNIFTYLRALSYFDKSLFVQLKKFMPARADVRVGYLIEQHALERPKARPQTTMVFAEDLLHEGTISLFNISSASALYETILDMRSNVSFNLLQNIGGDSEAIIDISSIALLPSNNIGSIYSYPILIMSESIKNNVLTLTSGTFSWNVTQSQALPASDFWFDSSSFTPITGSNGSVVGYSPSHYRFHNDYTTGRQNLFYNGCLQTVNTTTDKRLPFESNDAPFTKITVVNADSNRPRLKVE